jgi:hypothetical protein
MHMSLFISSIFEVDIGSDVDSMGVELAAQPKFVPASHYVAKADSEHPQEDARVASYLALKVLHRWMGEQLEDMAEELEDIGTVPNMTGPEGGAKA